MSEACTVGLDVGSTYVKAVLVGPGGDEIATARRPTPWTGSDGYAEMTGRRLLETVTGVLADLAADVAGGRSSRSACPGWRRRVPCWTSPTRRAAR